jgi:hypothetical protein
MTVAELIKKLEDFDPNLVVELVYDVNYGPTVTNLYKSVSGAVWLANW